MLSLGCFSWSPGNWWGRSQNSSALLVWPWPNRPLLGPCMEPLVWLAKKSEVGFPGSPWASLRRLSPQKKKLWKKEILMYVPKSGSPKQRQGQFRTVGLSLAHRNREGRNGWRISGEGWKYPSSGWVGSYKHVTSNNLLKKIEIMGL